MKALTAAIEPLMPASEVLARAVPADADKRKVAQEFEALVLRQMLETVLPESKGAAFGGGAAGGVWRSMLADQVAGVLSRSNVLGIELFDKTGNGAQQ